MPGPENLPEALLSPGQGFGDLWMWLQLMWLQFEVVRGPVGVVHGWFGAGLGPLGSQAGFKSDPTGRLKPKTPMLGNF